MSNDYLLALILGIIEGLTEFLPISSTGHMLIAEQALGVDLEKDYWKMFTIVIQMGAILGVVVYYWGRLGELVRDFAFPNPGHPPRWRHPLVLILAAVVPAGIVGVLMKKHIDKLMEKALPIGLALMGGALAIEIIEWACRGRGRVKDATQVSPAQALGIGLAQVASLIPGVSRSAATIMGGRICNLDMRAAADFSFLLSIPTMAAATGFSLSSFLYKNTMPLDLEKALVLATGFITAFVVALLVVVWFLRYVQTHSFRLFVVYRLVVGLAILMAWYKGLFPNT
jgi:undecaprenyl-diphosphatase